MEQLDNIKELLKKILGWDLKEHKNTTSHKSFKEYFSQKDQKLLIQHNQWDIKLYNLAKNEISLEHIAYYNNLANTIKINPNNNNNQNNNPRPLPARTKKPMTENYQKIQQLILNDQNKISIAFLHMYKAGGTTFCKNIRHTFPISSYQKLHNCNLRYDGPNNSRITSKDKTCDQRINEVEKIKLKCLVLKDF